MSNFSEFYARDPDIQSAVRHARIDQTVKCVRMVRRMRRRDHVPAFRAALTEVETLLLAGARRLKRGQAFKSSTTRVDRE